MEVNKCVGGRENRRGGLAAFKVHRSGCCPISESDDPQDLHLLSSKWLSDRSSPLSCFISWLAKIPGKIVFISPLVYYGWGCGLIRAISGTGSCLKGCWPDFPAFFPTSGIASSWSCSPFVQITCCCLTEGKNLLWDGFWLISVDQYGHSLEWRLGKY
jgi:hypothetical protein